MIVGIVSDSHDNMCKIERGLADFENRGVETILHAGDFVAPFALKAFLRAGLPFIGVYGNNDGEREGLGKMHNKLFEGPHRFSLADRTVLMAHEKESIEQARQGDEDLIIFGHNHAPDIVVDSSLWVNPGEMGGWLTGRSTGAIVNLREMTAELIEFGEQETPL